MADEIAELVVKITGDASDLESTINGVASELSKIEKAQGGGNSVTASGTKGLEAYGQQLQNTGKSIKDFGEGLDTVTKPLQYTAAALATGGVAAAKLAIDFEDSFASVKKTVDGTPEQLDAIKQSIIDMSTVGINGHSAIPMTTAELNELAAAGGQLGIQTENIADFTEVMAQMGTATNLVGEEGAATLARFMNVMGISQSEIRNVGSAIVDLGNNSATTEAEIAAMALRMGKYGSTIGMSAADVLGYSAALSSLGIEAQMGGSAVGRTWLSIETAVANGGESLKAFAKYAGTSAKEFKEQWNTDSKGAFNGLLKGLQSADNLTIALKNIGVENTQDIQAMMALVNGYDLVAESVERANTAYQENTALQAEFDAKAETTASQLAIVKNNFVEVARSIGETMLPTIKDASAGLADWAQGIASMDDSQKKTLVNTAAGVVALGAGAKVTTGAIKGIGNTIEAIGKIKSTATFNAISTAIGAIPLPAKLAVAGIAALGVAGKVAYDTWYDSQYRWSEGLSEGNEKIRESVDKYKQITDIQGQIKSLKLIIDNPDSSKAQVDDAKAKLEGIKTLLSEEYNLVINSDNSNLDDTVEKVRQISKNELQTNINQQRSKLASLKIKDTNYENDLTDATKKYNEYLDVQTELSETKEKITDLNTQVTEGEISTADAYNKAKDIYKDVMGTDYRPTDQALDNLNGLLSAVASKYGVVTEEVGKYDEKIKNLNGSHKELQAVSEELANWETELIKIAVASGDSEGVAKALKDMSSFIETGKLDMSGYAQAAALAMNGVDKLKTAWEQATNGDGTALTGIVNDYIRAMNEFGASAEETATGAALIKSGFSDVSQVTAETLPTVLNNMRELGNAQGLDMTAEKLTQMAQAIKLIPQNTKIEFDGEGNIVLKVDDTEVEEYEAPDKPGKAPYSPDTSQVDAWTPPEKQGKVIYNAVMPEQFRNTNYGKFGANVFQQAKGTQNFPGGLAMVNDERGVSDPRELIEHNGQLMMFSGRDVVVPLSAGDKVYTAAQTKAIMSGLGIPHYAEGKNNSDAFTAAKDDYSHYTKTHAVTTAEQLEKWLEFQEQYKENEKDIWDIEEQIFSLQQKLYSERVSESEKWLAHEEKYNGMGVDDYLAGIDRMKAYTEEYYAQGIISHKEYTDAMLDLDEKYIDKRKEQLEELYDLSKAYISEHTYFNDWAENGDDPLAAYNRVMDRHREALANGDLTQEEFNDYAKEIGSDMYSERKEQSLNWLEEQRKYFGMSDEEYVRGLERIKEYTQQYYNEGLISRKEYNEAMTELNHSAWDEAESTYEDMLSKQQEYISDLREQFSKQEQALRDSWDVEDRAIDMADVQNQLDVYKGAVTDRGQQKYKELQEQMKQLRRDEELYNLQVKNTATIDALQADYEQAEAMKADFLKDIALNTDIDVSGIVNDLTNKITGTGDNITSLLSQLLTAFNGFQINAPSTTYADNRIVNVSGLSLSEFASKFMGELR